MAITKESQLERLLNKIKQLQKSNFFGQVQLDFQNGNVVLVRLMQTEKLENDVPKMIGESYAQKN